ncbi:MAG: hypothetical protein MRY74_11705 [Neomegalonema sp.]|nr:hypothetical protein [Neomegalonema sp.]
MQIDSKQAALQHARALLHLMRTSGASAREQEKARRKLFDVLRTHNIPIDTLNGWIDAEEAALDALADEPRRGRWGVAMGVGAGGLAVAALVATVLVNGVPSGVDTVEAAPATLAKPSASDVAPKGLRVELAGLTTAAKATSAPSAPRAHMTDASPSRSAPAVKMEMPIAPSAPPVESRPATATDAGRRPHSSRGVARILPPVSLERRADIDAKPASRRGAPAVADKKKPAALDSALAADLAARSDRTGVLALTPDAAPTPHAPPLNLEAIVRDAGLERKASVRSVADRGAAPLTGLKIVVAHAATDGQRASLLARRFKLAGAADVERRVVALGLGETHLRYFTTDDAPAADIVASVIAVELGTRQEDLKKRDYSSLSKHAAPKVIELRLSPR